MQIRIYGDRTLCMALRRSYGEACAASHALDLVGERWALLVVRELLLGPKCFTDLRAGLAGVSTNVLAERLGELERSGVVRRRKLPPPAASRVYELTEWGEELEPVIVSLGSWGARSPFRLAGKIMPSRYPPYGYEYDRDRRTYLVDESRMEAVRTLFRMVGEEGRTFWACKRALDAAGYETRTGGDWHPSTLRDMILNDVYLAHTKDELRGLGVTEEVLASLDPGALYGVSWYNIQKVETLPSGRQIKNPRGREDWIAVPIQDAGIPRECVLAARKRIENNVRGSDAGHRYWTLKSLVRCPCGTRLTPFTVRRLHDLTFYYVCGRHRNTGKGPCPHARYHPATINRARKNPEEGLEERIESFVLGLIEDPSVLREHVREQADKEKRALGNSRERAEAVQRVLDEADGERDRYTRLYARGKLYDAEYDRYTAELDARRKAAEQEMERMGDTRDRIEYLERLPRMVEAYLRDLPELVRGAGLEVREYETIPEERTPDNPLGVYRLTPERIRERTPEEVEEIRRERERDRGERLRALYEVLGLSAVAHRDGTLEIFWGEHGRCKLEGSPTSTAAPRGSSSSPGSTPTSGGCGRWAASGRSERAPSELRPSTDPLGFIRGG